MLQYQRDAVASRYRRPWSSQTWTPSPRSKTSSPLASRTNMSAKGCQKLDMSLTLSSGATVTLNGGQEPQSALGGLVTSIVRGGYRVVRRETTPRNRKATGTGPRPYEPALEMHPKSLSVTDTAAYRVPGSCRE